MANSPHLIHKKRFLATQRAPDLQRLCAKDERCVFVGRGVSSVLPPTTVKRSLLACGTASRGAHLVRAGHDVLVCAEGQQHTHNAKQKRPAVQTRQELILDGHWCCCLGLCERRWSGVWWRVATDSMLRGVGTHTMHQTHCGEVEWRT